MDLVRWIKRHAAFAPDHQAIAFAGHSISYRAFAGMIETAAGRLRATGVTAGSVVAYLGLNSPELLTLLFACARLNAMLLPLNWRLTPAEHERVLQDCRPRAVVAEPAFFAHAATLRTAMPDVAWVALGDAPAGWTAWDNLDEVAGRESAPSGDAPVLLCYTSGSTGAPKGVVLTQTALFYNAVNSAHMHDLTSADRVLTTLPMFHVGGLNILTTPALHAGASVSLHAKFDPGEAIEAIERERITLTVLVPAQLSAMMEHPRWQDADFRSLRVVTTGSTIIPAAFVRKIHERGLRLIQIYGSTETCPIAAYQRADTAVRKAGSAGLPALHCDLRIVDHNGRDVAAGTDGEILVRGPNVMREYLNAPKATAAALRDGWYHSGDVGHLDGEGYLHVVSRKSDMIISGGENIYPAEIESVLLECADIADAGVVGRPDERWGEAVVAVVVLKPGVRMTAADVMALLDGRIARYKHPREVRFMEALPRSALGKVMKDSLRAAVSSASAA
jgi:fatty-acyl-CoA synthase